MFRAPNVMVSLTRLIIFYGIVVFLVRSGLLHRLGWRQLSFDYSMKGWLLWLVEESEVDFDMVFMLLWVLWKAQNTVVWKGKLSGSDWSYPKYFELAAWILGFQSSTYPSEIAEVAEVGGTEWWLVQVKC